MGKKAKGQGQKGTPLPLSFCRFHGIIFLPAQAAEELPTGAKFSRQTPLRRLEKKTVPVFPQGGDRLRNPGFLGG